MTRLPIAASILTFSKYQAVVVDYQHLSTLAHLDPSSRKSFAAGTARQIVRHVIRTQDLRILLMRDASLVKGLKAFATDLNCSFGVWVLPTEVKLEK
jgi:hypothetical protein